MRASDDCFTVGTCVQPPSRPLLRTRELRWRVPTSVCKRGVHIANAAHKLAASTLAWTAQNPVLASIQSRLLTRMYAHSVHACNQLQACLGAVMPNGLKHAVMHNARYSHDHKWRRVSAGTTSCVGSSAACDAPVLQSFFSLRMQCASSTCVGPSPSAKRGKA